MVGNGRASRRPADPLRGAGLDEEAPKEWNKDEMAKGVDDGEPGPSKKKMKSLGEQLEEKAKDGVWWLSRRLRGTRRKPRRKSAPKRMISPPARAHTLSRVHPGIRICKGPQLGEATC